MVGAFEQEAKIALKFAVIGGVQHVEIVAPAAIFDGFHDRTDGFVNEFVFYVRVGIDFAHLIGSQCCRHPFCWSLIVRHECSVVPSSPMTQLGIDNFFALRRIGNVTLWQVEVFPIHAMHF